MSGNQGKLGLSVRDIPEDMASKLGISGGVLIDNVRPGSFADELQQLRPGQIILQVNRKPVNSVSQFQSVVDALKPGDDIVFMITDPRDNSHGNTYVGGTMP